MEFRNFPKTSSCFEAGNEKIVEGDTYPRKLKG